MEAMKQGPDLPSLFGAADREGFSLFRVVNHRRSAYLIEQDLEAMSDFFYVGQFLRLKKHMHRDFADVVNSIAQRRRQLQTDLGQRSV
jgi:hypothetical protein